MEVWELGEGWGTLSLCLLWAVAGIRHVGLELWEVTELEMRKPCGHHLLKSSSWVSTQDVEV